MEQFNTIENVKDMFQKVNGIGKTNCYFLGYVTTPTSAAVLGGAVGGIIAGMKANAENQCQAYLINQTENGIGLIPLNSTSGTLLSYKPDKLIATPERFTFINQNDIASVKIKRANLISLVSKNVIIELNNGRKYNLQVNNKEKNIPYHEANFAEFMNRYKK